MAVIIHNPTANTATIGSKNSVLRDGDTLYDEDVYPEIFYTADRLKRAGVPPKYWVFERESGSFREADEGEMRVRDREHSQYLNAQAYQEIDRAVQRAIDNGFEYNGKRFSLSRNAQLNALTMYLLRDSSALKYPIKINTIDNAEVESLQDRSSVEAFFEAGIGAIREALDWGAGEKEKVRSEARLVDGDGSSRVGRADIGRIDRR